MCKFIEYPSIFIRWIVHTIDLLISIYFCWTTESIQTFFLFFHRSLFPLTDTSVKMTFQPKYAINQPKLCTTELTVHLSPFLLIQLNTALAFLKCLLHLTPVILSVALFFLRFHYHYYSPHQPSLIILQTELEEFASLIDLRLLGLSESLQSF